MLKWLVRLLNGSFDMGLCLWTQCPYAKANVKNVNVATQEVFRISLLSVVGKLYDRLLIERVGAGTECAIGEEQCEFRQGIDCKDAWTKCLP